MLSTRNENRKYPLFYQHAHNYGIKFAWTRDRPKNGKPTEMTHRFLTYVMTVICFFLSMQEKAVSEHAADTGNMIHETVDTPADHSWSRVFLHDLSASDSPCNLTGPTHYSAPLRTSHNAKRPTCAKTVNINFIKSGKAYSRDSISMLLASIRRFPSGIEEPSHRFINLRKIVI